MSTKKKSKRVARTTTPTPEQHIRDRKQLFALAGKYADQTLFAALTGTDTAVPDSTDVLDALARRSMYFDEQKFMAADGDILCAAYDAGLALGYAYGLRLRGVK